MTSNDIRATFLQYFERHGHRIVPSSPLVPGDDPTLLFTNAGMNQFKDVFLGREKRDYRRAATSQKCMRVSGKHNDLDNVGPSLRHHTFFEMLGNFSFGDYFKKDAIPLAFELLTEVWKIPKDRLVVSIFKGEAAVPRDDEAYEAWRKLVPVDRILELGADDNFWQMGDTGPCGRCSEIYYADGADADPGIEIWNNVFMEFERRADGTLTPLSAPSIDTGMGLERITAVLQQKDSNYDTDLFTPLLDAIGDMAGLVYGAHQLPPLDTTPDGLTGEERAERLNVSMRVVADHVRATAFLIADGVIPSNEWRGYVLRKIMRRAMRHGRHLQLTDPFLFRLVEVLADEMGDAYPELRTHRETIEKTVREEEKRFQVVLSEGLPRLEAEITKALETSDHVLPGETAFRLYDTFGLPYDFIDDTAATQDVRVDRAGYERAMEDQRSKGRAKSGFGAKDEKVWRFRQPAAKALNPDDFVGYQQTKQIGVAVGLLLNDKREEVDELRSGDHGYIVVPVTPFYLESGGQVSDRGEIYSEAGPFRAVVEGVDKIGASSARAHRVRVVSGSVHPGEIVTAEVDAELRAATRRNHTATHLLHAALREILGTHVKQAGSLVAPDRLRFDFVHFQHVTRGELDRIEQIVNEQICRNTPVQTEERSTEEAIAAGAMALFGEKYGDTVRVVSVPDFSMELCGGTHVSATGDIGFFAITGESGVAAGVRRIEAVTGGGAIQRAQHQRAALASVLEALNVPAEQAVESIERLRSDGKRLARENTRLKTEMALEGLRAATKDDIADSPALRGLREAAEESVQGIVEVSGVKLARRKVSDFDKDTLRGLVDSLKAKIKSGVVVVASASDGKVQIVVAVTPDLTGRIKAGQVVKEIAPIVGGSGGGRPDFAEAGGKQPDKIDEMLKAAEGVISKMLGA